MPFSNRILFSMLAITVSSDNCLAAQDATPETEMSASDVMLVRSDKDWVLVDTRATDAYNGWALDGIERGGHIPDAVDFPASWIDIDHKDKSETLAEALRTKGITRDKHILLYSTTEHERHRVGTYLRDSGFRNSLAACSHTDTPPTFPGGFDRQFAEHLAYDKRDIKEELRLVDVVRSQMVRILRSLPSEAFERTGIHAVRGPMTLRTLLEAITNHIPHHVRFIEEKKQAMESGG